MFAAYVVLSVKQLSECETIKWQANLESSSNCYIYPGNEKDSCIVLMNAEVFVFARLPSVHSRLFLIILQEHK